jgi:hypothetical protein
LFDPGLGAPIAATALGVPEGFIIAATSSLEKHNDSELLISGTFARNSQTPPVPAMWSLDETSLALKWFWAPQDAQGFGYTAIPQPGEGPLLAGQVIPAAGPIGGFDDAILARTRSDGEGLCPRLPELVQLELPVVALVLETEVIEMPEPIEAQLEISMGQPLFREICELQLPCPTDLDNDGDTDIDDLLERLRNDPAFAAIKDRLNEGDLLDPMQYVGLAVEQTERYVERMRRELGEADHGETEVAERLRV